MNRQRPATKNRRRDVLAAALECFSETDVEAVSIADICARSGASVGSVYHHFGSKEGLVVALIADGLQAHLDALREALDCTRGDPRGGIEAVIGSLIDWIEANPGWAMFIYANLSNSGAASAEPIRNVNRQYGQLIDGFFGPLIEAGRVRRVPRDCWSSLIVAPVHDYARRWLRGQVSNRPSIERQVFVDAAWRVIRTE